MSATLFVQPLDLVKNRMQLSGEGGTAKAYKNSFHAITSIVKAEGVTGIYTGYKKDYLNVFKASVKKIFLSNEKKQFTMSSFTIVFFVSMFVCFTFGTILLYC